MVDVYALGRWIAALSLVVMVAACGTRGEEQRELDYGESTVEERGLEVPPDLNLRAGDGRYTIPRGRNGQAEEGVLLPEGEDVRFVRDGGERWLEVARPAEELWSHLESFWKAQGFELSRSEPATGVIETDWREALSDKPDGALRRLLGPVGNRMYSAGMRDQYRLRVERGDHAEQTRVFIVHRGRERIRDGEAFRWASRESEEERATEMMRRLLVYLGVERPAAEGVVDNGVQDGAARGRLELARDAEERPVLDIDAGFARSWRMVGRALEQRGFRIEDRDRSEGIYYIRYMDPDGAAQEGGFFRRMAFWRSEEPAPTDYQLRLVEGDRVTRLGVFDEAGNQLDSATAERILTLVQEQLAP